MNKVTLIGNVTANPEVRETASGITLCRFSIAVNRAYTGTDGERKTDFFNCTAWRGLGDTVARYVHKGGKVAVSGAIETSTYEDSNGNKRTAFEIVAKDVEFLSPKKDGSMRPDIGSDDQ